MALTQKILIWRVQCFIHALFSFQSFTQTNERVALPSCPFSEWLYNYDSYSDFSLSSAIVCLHGEYIYFHRVSLKASQVSNTNYKVQKHPWSVWTCCQTQYSMHSQDRDRALLSNLWLGSIHTSTRTLGLLQVTLQDVEKKTTSVMIQPTHRSSSSFSLCLPASTCLCNPQKPPCKPLLLFWLVGSIFSFALRRNVSHKETSPFVRIVSKWMKKTKHEKPFVCLYWRSDCEAKAGSLPS